MDSRTHTLGPQRPPHPAWIEVDLDALVHNAGVLRRATPGDAQLGLLVKANGYGHGLVPAARAALAGGADQLIVATLDEGLALRRAGVSAPVLVVYPIQTDDIADAVEAELELTVSGITSCRRSLDAWSRAHRGNRGRSLRLHVEVDTGMGRGGADPQGVPEVVARILEAQATVLAGFWSHLADGRDPAATAEQVRRFDASLAGLDLGGDAPRRHLVATEALFARTAPAYDLVRIGLGFYGELGLDFSPAPSMQELASELRPAMSIKARPVRLERLPSGATVGYGSEWVADRPTLVATLPIGYADGWTRSSWPGAVALVHGRRVPLIGRVSMDSVCADVTEIAGVTPDDEFVLLGEQGGDRITVNELAALRGTIPNEVLCSFGGRLQRIYRGLGLDR